MTLKRKILVNDIIIFEIHIWHFVVFLNQSSTKLNKDLWGVYKTLYMQKCHLIIGSTKLHK